jgi:uncharacterized protein DUF6883
MQLPNGDRAVVEINKLRDYCLNQTHPRGRHKARVFESALGLTHQDAPRLRALLLEAARTTEIELGERDSYGQRYILNLPMTGPLRTVTIRSCWIVLTAEDIPRLTSCWVL